MDAEQSDNSPIKVKTPRSRYILLEQLSSHELASQVNWAELLPLETDATFYSSLNAQIEFVRQTFPQIDTIRELTAIFHISNSTYYMMFPPTHRRHASKSAPPPVSKVGRPSLVSADLEQKLLLHICGCQNRCDCLSPRECREFLSEELSTATQSVIIDRYWWRRFLTRHPELVVRRCDSRESARAEVHRDHVTPYLDALAQRLSQEFHPDLVINMDESGFTARPLKGSQKNCVFSSVCPIKPRFLERQDANHVTLVGAVTLSGSMLIPLLLSTRVHLPPDIAESYIAGEFRYVGTKKGYLTGQAMDHWVRVVLIPHLAEVRTRLGRLIGAVLILDGLRSHSTEFTRLAFRDHQIHVIELPAHTTHLYQPLDLCLFGVAKKEYRIADKSRTGLREKLSMKIERVIKAWHRACYRGNVLAAWRSAGFVHVFRNGTLTAVTVNPTWMMLKIAE